MKKIDFFARWPHFADHMVPIYKKLGEHAGEFFVAPNVSQHVENMGIRTNVLKPKTQGNQLEVAPEGTNPLLIAGSGDMQMAYARNASRSFILMEHGPGITFPNNSSYAGNHGFRKLAALTLAPNFDTYQKTKNALPDNKQVIIGTPMLDPWCEKFEEPKILPAKPTVCISFHWDGSRVQPEAGNAFRHYEKFLPKLAACPDFKLIAHGHPRNLNDLAPLYKRLGIEIVWGFEEMMNRTNLLINDSSSIAYMFLVTGWPVILLNAPWFRKKVNFGLRFWDYTDIAEQVEDPKELFNAISRALSNLDARKTERKSAIEHLFPYLGYSSIMAARAIRKQFP